MFKPLKILLVLLVSLQLCGFSNYALAQSVDESASQAEATAEAAAGSAAVSAVASMAAAATPITLDLSSTQAQFTAATAGVTQAVSIMVGESSRVVQAADLVTAAELVAVSQMANSGAQALQLSALGAAVGGGFSLTPSLAGMINDLVIPTDVHMMHDFSSVSALSLAGSFTNAGTLTAFSSNPQVNNAVISALNIYNQPGALITSILPASMQMPNVGVLNLNLNAINNIVNNGAITSSGALTMTAGGSITNATVPGGVTAMLQAMSSVNLNASNVINSGLISAMTGNINIASQMASSLAVNNASGVLSALNGSINIGNILNTAKVSTALTGGDVFANELNLYSGDGAASVNVGKLTALTNIYGGSAYVVAATDNLRIGNMVVTGDPLLVNTAGDATISTPYNSAPGQPLTIVAQKNIVTAVGAGQVQTLNAAGSGGDILMVAGAQVALNGANYEITGGSSFGGKIDLVTGTPITSLSSASTGGGGNGGKITLVAYKGSVGDSGTISTPVGVSITSAGNGVGSAGDILMVAGADTSVTSISIGVVSNAAGAQGTGNIKLYTSTPTISNSAATCSPCVRFDAATGLVQADSGSFDATRDGSLNVVAQPGSISTRNLTARASTIDIVAGLNATIGTAGTVITNNGTAGGQNGGTVSIITSSATAFTIGSAVTNGTAGIISATASGAGSAGSVSIANQGTGGIAVAVNITANNGTGATGSISLTASGTGTITRTAGSLNTGTLNLTSGSGDIGLLATPIVMSAAALTLNTTGSAFASEAGAITLNTSNIGGTLSLVTTGAGTITLTGPVTANILTVSANSGSNIAVAGSMTANGGITLTTAGAGTKTGAGTLNSTGLLTINSGTGASTLNTAVGQVTSTTANGGVTLTQTGHIQVNAVSNGSGVFSVTTDSGSNITVTDNVTANGGITLNTNAAGTGVVSRTGTVTLSSTGTVALTGGSGGIGSILSPMLTAAGTVTLNSGADAYVSETNAVTLGASTVTGILELTTGSGGNITYNAN